MLYSGLIHTYKQRLPFFREGDIVSLCEGNTPLIKLANLPKKLNAKNLQVYVKFEGLNPTGSFKDRGMTTAISHAKSLGQQAVICASTGNTSAAAAAYAAKSRIKAFILIPEGKIAYGKLVQAIVYGAEVIQIQGNFDEGMRLVKEICEANSAIGLVNSVNPYRLQGQKTASFEIYEALGKNPDFHYIPVGNAGNISAYWMGYNEILGVETASSMKETILPSSDRRQKFPKMIGFQAAGSAPFIAGEPIQNPETLATAIRIGNPQSWDYAIRAVRDSDGWFGAISDEVILRTQAELGALEGVYCEPASCASVAGLVQDDREGKLPDNATVVCTLTGNGLKDTQTSMDFLKNHKIASLEASYSQVADYIQSCIG